MQPRNPDLTMLATRLPATLVRAIQARAKREKRTVTDVVRTAIAAGLPEARSVEAEVRALRREVEALRRAIEGRKP